MTQHWPSYRLQELLGMTKPLILAPMAGAGGIDLALGVAKAGGLASIPCAMLGPDAIRAQVKAFRTASDQPFNLNFFCHTHQPVKEDEQQRWCSTLAPYYQQAGLDIDNLSIGASRASFNEELCSLVEELKAPIVSFHFGLPEAALVDRLKASGIVIMSSATSVKEAEFLEKSGCDVIIAQGAEAGGHRAMFLEASPSNQCGTMALVPQIVDAVRVPVVAAGGIADGRGIAAAFALGAVGVQVGTAYLSCPESLISALHRDALKQAHDQSTEITTLFTGKPSRGITNKAIRQLGALPDSVPTFPHAVHAINPLRAHFEKHGSSDFTPLWAGQAAGLNRNLPADELSYVICQEALSRMHWLKC